MLLAATRTVAYKAALVPLSVLPGAVAEPLERGVSRFNYRRLHRDMRVNPDVQGALGLSGAGMEVLVRRAVDLQTAADVESSRYGRLRPQTIGRLLDMRGMEKLGWALEQGRGAILFSGHSHSQYALFAGLGAAGVGAHVVGHPPLYGHNPAERWFAQRRFNAIERRSVCRFLWMQEGNFGVAVKAANVLKSNGVVVMLIDKPSTGRRVDVRFLGRPSPFPPGPALLARSTGAQMLHVGLHRDVTSRRHVAEIGEPFPAAGKVEQTMQRCAEELERHVLRYPADWNLLWAPARVWGGEKSEWMRPDWARSGHRQAS